MSRSTSKTPGDRLLERTKKCQENGQFTDYTVICGGRRFAEYRVVIFPQCSVLRAAGTSGFVETVTNEFTMTEDSPEYVQRLMEFFYTGEYEASWPQDRLWNPGQEPSPLRIHQAMLELSDKYDVEDLGALAESRFKARMNTNVSYNELWNAVRTVYSSPVPAAKKLVEPLVTRVEGLSSQILEEASRQTSMEKILVEVPEFAKDLTMACMRKLAA